MARSQDEKHQKLIRQLIAENPDNKKCMDCGQNGPVYANVSFGTFICETCSGIHREFSHRVKSISMATFTPAEVQLLHDTGNLKARQKWRARWNSEDAPMPDTANREGLRRFIRATYVDQRWVAGNEPAPRATKVHKEVSPPNGNTKKAAARHYEEEYHNNTVPRPEPLSNILGPDIPKLSVGGQRQSSAAATASLIDLLSSDPAPAPVAHAPVVGQIRNPSVPTPTATAPAPAAPSSMDLLAGLDFGTPQPSNNQGVFNPYQHQQQQTAPMGDFFAAQPQQFQQQQYQPQQQQYQPQQPQHQPQFVQPQQQQAWQQHVTAALSQIGITNPQYQQQIMTHMLTMPMPQQQQYMMQLRQQQQMMMQQQQQQQHQQQQQLMNYQMQQLSLQQQQQRVNNNNQDMFASLSPLGGGMASRPAQQQQYQQSQNQGGSMNGFGGASSTSAQPPASGSSAAWDPFA